MANLKQIEVNGTTYDIGIPGSDIPIICEVYNTSASEGNSIDELNAASSSDTTYTALSAEFCLKSVDNGDGTHNYSIVVAIPNTEIS